MRPLCQPVIPPFLPRLLLISALLYGACLIPVTASASSISVAPTMIELAAAGGTGLLYVANDGPETVMVQTEAFAWSQTGGKDLLTASPDIEISPPIARLEPGKKQLVRVLVKAPDSSGGRVGGVETGKERCFRLVISELPEAAKAEKQTVHVLLQFSVPLFAGPSRASEQDLSWAAKLSDGKLQLAVLNKGSSHMKISSLRIMRKADGAPFQPNNTILYVLPHSSMNLNVGGKTIKTGDSLRLTGHDDRNDRALETDLIVSP